MPAEQDADHNAVFSFKDPRLHHLNAGFSRSELQIRNIEQFSDDPVKLAAAIDDIIKFNCEVNEYNYMNDLAKKFKKVLVPKVLGTKHCDWNSLFQKYNSQKDGLLIKQDLKQMMLDSGLSKVTDAEMDFAFNPIAKFKQKLNFASFQAWVEEMSALAQKSLI